MSLWPHQSRAVDETLSLIAQGERRLLVTSPTGGGKTRIACKLIEDSLLVEKKVVLYTNRRLLLDQLSDVLRDNRLLHGVRAAGETADPDAPLQLSSIGTEHSRVTRQGKWELCPADLVIIDEAHLQKSPATVALLGRHVDQGAALVGLTATPLGLDGLYTRLVVAGTNSELRACGALVMAQHYGPDEPDLKGLKISEGEDLSEAQARKAMMSGSLFGRVWDNFEKINPEHRPTILFAPDVEGSIWFAERFTAKGVPAAHIDGKHVWIGGKLYATSTDAREDILGRSLDGRLTCLCNRFVLREGIDCPWLQHAIFATIFGSLQTYLQSGGRLLRAYPGVSQVTIQDHGGNWWRHGSLNADREWTLGLTATMAFGLRADAIREGRLKEPFRCPACTRIIMAGKCLGCGWQPKGKPKRSRAVITREGELKLREGSCFRPHRISQRPDGPKQWERMYFRSRSTKGARTFRAAMALFAQENQWGWPDPRWPFMPKDWRDHYRLVADVPRERLT